MIVDYDEVQMYTTNSLKTASKIKLIVNKPIKKIKWTIKMNSINSKEGRECRKGKNNLKNRNQIACWYI